MKQKLKILHLESITADAELIEKELKKCSLDFEKLVVDNEKDFAKALSSFHPDIILSNHSLPSFNAAEALKMLKSSGIGIPFILFTSPVSEAFAVDILKSGATDYILKDNIKDLPSAIRQAFNKYRHRADIIKAEQELFAAHNALLFHLENSPLGYIEWDNKLRPQVWSEKAASIFGWTLKEFTDNKLTGYDLIFSDENENKITRVVKKLITGVIEKNKIENRNYAKGGKIIWCEWFNSVLRNSNGKVVRIVSLVHDITDRKNADEALIKSELRFKDFFETAPEALFMIDPVSRYFCDYNDNALELLDCTATKLLEKGLADFSPEFQQDETRSVSRLNDYIDQAVQGKKPVFKWMVLGCTGQKIFCEIRLSILFNNPGKPLIRASLLDIRDRVELEQKVIEEQIKKQVEITDAVINAQEKERAFLGEELHDNINQLLATSRLYLDFSISSNEIRKDMIITGRNYITDAMEEIRKLSKSLIAPSLGDISLEEAVADLISNIQLVDKLHFEKKWENVDEKKIGSKLKLTIFRIIQEQLNNVLKHARAKNVWVKLIQNKKALQLIVKDDGIGFDTTTKRKGVGLKNIFSRTSLFKGDVNIESRPGKGCIMKVRFDIKETETAII